MTRRRITEQLGLGLKAVTMHECKHLILQCCFHHILCWSAVCVRSPDGEVVPCSRGEKSVPNVHVSCTAFTKALESFSIQARTAGTCLFTAARSAPCQEYLWLHVCLNIMLASSAQGHDHTKHSWVKPLGLGEMQLHCLLHCGSQHTMNTK